MLGELSSHASRLVYIFKTIQCTFIQPMFSNASSTTYCLLACNFYSLFPFIDNTFISRLFGAKPNRFLLHRILLNYSAILDVQTKGFNRVVDMMGESLTLSWSHRFRYNQGFEDTLSHMPEEN